MYLKVYVYHLDVVRNHMLKAKKYNLATVNKPLHRLSSAYGRIFVCSVFGLCTLAGSKTKHTKLLPQAEEDGEEVNSSQLRDETN